MDHIVILLTMQRSLNNGETVTDIFSLTTSDTQGGTASSTLTITIIGKGATLQTTQMQ